MIDFKNLHFGIFGLLGCLVSMQTVWANEDAVRIDGPEATSVWAVSEETGQIFCAAKSAGQVIEYDLTGKEAKRYDVGAEPGKMIFKSGKLVVACSKSPSLYVIDIKARKVLGKIDVGGTGPFALFCSKVKNPFVYCSIESANSRSRDYAVLQTDIDQLAVNHRFEITHGAGWRRNEPRNVAMSVDGKWMVLDERGKSSPSGAFRLAVDEDKFEFTPMNSHHESFGPIFAGPANRFWTLGNALYETDIEKQLRTYSGPTVTIHPTLDLVASTDGQKVFIERFSDAKKIETIPLQETTEPRKSSRSRRRPKPKDICLRFVPQHQRLVMGLEGKCFVVNLANALVSAKPAVLMVNSGNMRMRPGEKMNVPVRLTHPEMQKKSRFELKLGPKNATLRGNQLKWAPDENALGIHEFVVEAALDDRKDSIRFEVLVELPNIELNFNIAGIEVDRKGHYAIAWGPKRSDDPRQRFRPSQMEGPVEFAVLDLNEHKVVVQKSLNKGVSSAIVDDKFVYFVPGAGSVLYRVDRKTLGDSKRQFLQGRVLEMSKFQRDSIALITVPANGPQHFANTCQIIDRQTLKQRAQWPLGSQFQGHSRNKIISWVGPDMLALPGKVLDASSGDVVALTARPNLPIPGESQNRGYWPGSPTTREIFGHWLENAQLQSHFDQRIATISSRTRTISPYAPVLFALRSNDRRSGGSGTPGQSYIDARSLVDGSVVDSKLIEIQKIGMRPAGPFSNNFMVPRRDRLVVAMENKVVGYPITKQLIEKLPMPLHFPLRKLPVLDAQQTGKLDVSATGGDGKLEYSLGEEAPWIDIDTETGLVSIDTPQLWQKHVKSLTGSRTPGAMLGSHRRSSRNQPTPEEQFELLMGKPAPAGTTPFAIPVHVIASDENGQQDRARFYVVALGSTKEVSEKLASQEAAMKKLRAEQEKAREERRKEQEKQRAMRDAEAQREAAKQNANQPGRIEELERRMRRLEATLDSVLDKLDRIEEAVGNSGG